MSAQIRRKTPYRFKEYENNHRDKGWFTLDRNRRRQRLRWFAGDRKACCDPRSHFAIVANLITWLLELVNSCRPKPGSIQRCNDQSGVLSDSWKKNWMQFKLLAKAANGWCFSPKGMITSITTMLSLAWVLRKDHFCERLSSFRNGDAAMMLRLYSAVSYCGKSGKQAPTVFPRL